MSDKMIFAEQKNIFLVLGMARSGTSAIARGLKALGIDLGHHLVSTDTKWNPKGFWEDSEIVYEINGKIFKTLHFAPYGIEEIEPQKQLSAELQAIKNGAVEIVQNRFATTNYWGFKDPSTVKLLTFWQDIFTNLKINDHYIIALRNPLAVAKSYHSLTRSDLEIGLLLWLMHTFQAIENTHGKNRIVVSYELLLEKPTTQLARIKKHFALPTLVTPDVIDAYINEFLDKKSTHFKPNEDDFRAHPATLVTPLCVMIYDLLYQLANDQISFTAQEFSSAWQEIKNELLNSYPIYHYMDMLLKRNYRLEKKIRNMQKSFIWKIFYPLIWIDDKLRERRQKLRELKRIPKAYG